MSTCMDGLCIYTCIILILPVVNRKPSQNSNTQHSQSMVNDHYGTTSPQRLPLKIFHHDGLFARFQSSTFHIPNFFVGLVLMSFMLLAILCILCFTQHINCSTHNDVTGQIVVGTVFDEASLISARSIVYKRKC